MAPVWFNAEGGSANEGWYYALPDDDEGVGPLPSRSSARAALREESTTPRFCEACGSTFKPRRVDQRFCSDACRQRAHRARASQ